MREKDLFSAFGPTYFFTGKKGWPGPVYQFPAFFSAFAWPLFSLENSPALDTNFWPFVPHFFGPICPRPWIPKSGLLLGPCPAYFWSFFSQCPNFFSSNNSLTKRICYKANKRAADTSQSLFLIRQVSAIAFLKKFRFNQKM
jgi:hypothetical protein